MVALIKEKDLLEANVFDSLLQQYPTPVASNEGDGDQRQESSIDEEGRTAEEGAEDVAEDVAEEAEEKK